MQGLYEYVPLPERPRLTWPDGATLAVIVTVNVEAWDVARPDFPYAGGPDVLPIPGLPPGHEDFPNYTWREYGPRVGVWRLMEICERLGVQVSATLNASVGERYPQVVAAGKRAGWEFVAHGYEQHELLAFLAKDPDAERALVHRAVEAYTRVVGRRPEGWLSSSTAATLNTARLLADEGLVYMCDFHNDEQPFLLDAGGGRNLVAIPYSVEINDFPIFVRRGNTPDQFLAYVKQEFDVLLEESRRTALIMNVGLHPHVSGRPARARAVEELLRHMRRFDGVWFPRRIDLAQSYLAQVRPQAPRRDGPTP